VGNGKKESEKEGNSGNNGHNGEKGSKSSRSSSLSTTEPKLLIFPRTFDTNSSKY
jgi:hypothetical protein